MRSNLDYTLLVKSLHDAREILNQSISQLDLRSPEWIFLAHAKGHIQSQDDLFHEMFYAIPRDWFVRKC